MYEPICTKLIQSIGEIHMLGYGSRQVTEVIHQRRAKSPCDPWRDSDQGDGVVAKRARKRLHKQSIVWELYVV